MKISTKKVYTNLVALHIENEEVEGNFIIFWCGVQKSEYKMTKWIYQFEVEFFSSTEKRVCEKCLDAYYYK